MSDKFNDLLNRRGFFWQSFDAYKGMVEAGGFYDYGPLGVGLKRNIINKWLRTFVVPYMDFTIEVETPIIMPRIVFEASGHLENFTDFLVTCSKCGRKYRADHLVEDELRKRGVKIKTEGLDERRLDELISQYGVKCPNCGGELGNVQRFNLLFQTTIGPYSSNLGFIRPETAQGMFIDFAKLYELSNRRLPLAVAQVGKVGRNEISPRQGLVRLREFSQMEIELFFDPLNPRCPYLDDIKDVKIRILPEDDVAKGVNAPREVSVREAVEKGYIVNEWMGFYMGLATVFLNELGVPLDKQLFLAKLPEERAHYAKAVFDQVVLTERFGWLEVSGHAYRTDYDLSRHVKYSGQDLSAYRDLQVPRIEKEIRVSPNPVKIKEKYGGDAGKIIKYIYDNPDKVLRDIESTGKSVFEAFEISREMIYISEQERKTYRERFIPHVIEPSFGVDRLLYVTLENSFVERNGKYVLRLPPDIAPIKVAVLPLIRKDPYPAIGRRIWSMLVMNGIEAVYDDGDTIGSRYVKYDEEGVPFAVTIDDKTPMDNTVTLRDRDTTSQVRVPVDSLVAVISSKLYVRH
ncbi:glycine--tRNA ligase [Thermocladium modestius]|uniref:glycine--tRNA ligase n=1 Tax=Thermocladium modestius TaxID=62609 RepID=A0A830GXW7_9CREN|nr:glycine--tRNA ligase [Thermocladium modestius]GGP21953.1 glycine--tRNA ligase [Thermocladium modestius]